MEAAPQKPDNENISYTFHKEERLCSKKQFDVLFESGNSFLVHPIKVVFAETTFDGNYPAQAAFAVGRRSFKKAVERNRIKRMMREAYRLRKHHLYGHLGNHKVAVIFIFIAKTKAPFQQIEKAMAKALGELARRVNTL